MDEFKEHKKQLIAQIKRLERTFNNWIAQNSGKSDRQIEILNGIIERKKQALKENRVY